MPGFYILTQFHRHYSATVGAKKVANESKPDDTDCSALKGRVETIERQITNIKAYGTAVAVVFAAVFGISIFQGAASVVQKLADWQSRGVLERAEEVTKNIERQTNRAAQLSEEIRLTDGVLRIQSASCSIASSYTNYTATCNASCSDFETVVGGGCTVLNGSGALPAVVQSEPLGGNTWRCSFADANRRSLAGFELKVVSLCKPQPRNRNAG